MASNPKKGFADKKMIGRAISDSFIKLNPKTQAQNPVMLLVYISAILTTILWIIALCGEGCFSRLHTRNCDYSLVYCFVC
ncbi:MAG: hypothetical protein ACLRX7_04885 [Acutalibacteraceae bacterium]